MSNKEAREYAISKIIENFENVQKLCSFQPVFFDLEDLIDVAEQVCDELDRQEEIEK